MVAYKELSVEDMDLSLFADFDRTQYVTGCWTKINGKWLIKDVLFTENWSEVEYGERVKYLKSLLNSGGYVAGAFSKEQLKGFVSVEPAIFGTHAKYMNLSSIHVSRDMRGQGLGRELFGLAKRWAKERQAEKLYISAHPAVESQAFYQAMGCIEAVEYNPLIAEQELSDRQLECVL